MFKAIFDYRAKSMCGVCEILSQNAKKDTTIAVAKATTKAFKY
jgi:ribosomal protein S5